MTISNPIAFQEAVTASEGRKQSDIAAASSTSDYDAAIKAAAVGHWQRCADAADHFGMSATVYREALAFHARGV